MDPVWLDNLKAWWWLALMVFVLIVKAWIIFADVKKWQIGYASHPSHSDLIDALSIRTSEIQSTVKEVSVALDKQGQDMLLIKAALILMLDTMQKDGESEEGISEAKAILNNEKRY